MLYNIYNIYIYKECLYTFIYLCLPKRETELRCRQSKRSISCFHTDTTFTFSPPKPVSVIFIIKVNTKSTEKYCVSVAQISSR